MNNKLLIGILLGLLAIWGLSKFLSGGEGTFDPEIIAVDSAKVDKVVLQAKADEFKEAVLQKTADGWTIARDGKTYAATAESVQQFLSSLTSVSTSQIVAKSSDKWPQYELGDGQASHVTVFADGKKAADFYVGKFSVNQQAQQITSYLRLADQPDVYAVEGMAGMMLGQGSNAYRNKQVMQLTDPAINEVKLEGDVNYHLKKSPGGIWLLDGDAAADSTQVQNYLINLRNMSGDTFVDDFDPNLASDQLLKTLTLQGDNLPGQVVVRCWKDDTKAKPFIINSSQFPDAYFASDSTRLFTRLFKPVWEW